MELGDGLDQDNGRFTWCSLSALCCNTFTSNGMQGYHMFVSNLALTLSCSQDFRCMEQKHFGPYLWTFRTVSSVVSMWTKVAFYKRIFGPFCVRMLTYVLP